MNYRMVVALGDEKYEFVVDGDASYVRSLPGDGCANNCNMTHFPCSSVKITIKSFLTLVTVDKGAKTGNLYHINKRGNFSFSEWKLPENTDFATSVLDAVGNFWFDSEHREHLDAAQAIGIDFDTLHGIYEEIRK